MIQVTIKKRGLIMEYAQLYKKNKKMCGTYKKQKYVLVDLLQNI